MFRRVAALAIGLALAVPLGAAPPAATALTAPPAPPARVPAADLSASRVTLLGLRPRYVVGAPITLTAKAEVEPYGLYDLAVTGAVELFDGAASLGSTDQLDALHPATFTLAAGLPVGDHVLTARYSALGIIGESVSPPVNVSVEATDTWVDMDAMAPAYATFYPVKDSYRDTVIVSGRSYEPVASVASVVRNATGHVMWRQSQTGHGAGTMSVAWVPRSASGMPYPAGSYSMAVTVTDTAGNLATYTARFALSSRAVVWKTATEYQNGADYYYSNHSDFGWVSKGFSRFDHGVDIFGNLADEFAEVDYLYVPPTTVALGSVRFDILSEPSGTGDPAVFYFDKQPAFSMLTSGDYGVSSISAAGESVAGSYHSVAVVVRANGSDRAHIDIAGVRFTVRYAVWRP
jgi:hypothetical protein